MRLVRTVILKNPLPPDASATCVECAGRTVQLVSDGELAAGVTTGRFVLYFARPIDDGAARSKWILIREIDIDVEVAPEVVKLLYGDLA